MWECATATGTVRVVASTRPDGDFHLERVAPSQLEQQRRDLVDLPWTMLDERHGVDVVSVDSPGAGDRLVGDVMVTSLTSTVLGIWAADCASVVVVAERRLVAAHAGWRGLVAGVIDVAVDALGPFADARGFLGPCIGPCCYEFDPSDLELVARAVGVAPESLCGTTSWGTTSLDVPAAVAAASARHGITLDTAGVCTGCDDRYYSYRRRRDTGRHVVAVWKDVA